MLLALPAVQAACNSNRDAIGQYKIARDNYRRSLIAREARHEDVQAAGDSAIRDLERRLRPIIGEFRAPYVIGNGRINLETLLPGDEASGAADGMLYTSRDGTTRVLVSVDSLFDYWAAAPGTMPTDSGVRAALANPGILNQVFPIDAAVHKYREIPVPVSTRGFATALLVARAQDYCDCKPDEVFVSALRGHRVFIVDAPARDTLERPATCVVAAKEAAAASKALFDRALAMSPHDTVLLNKASAMDSVSDLEFRRCYGEHLTENSKFHRIVEQVAKILAGLPAR
jgi:hypothetical protein